MKIAATGIVVGFSNCSYPSIQNFLIIEQMELGQLLISYIDNILSSFISDFDPQYTAQY